MDDRRVLSVDENAVLERVNEIAERMTERSGLRHLLDEPATLWGAQSLLIRSVAALAAARA
ncbi:hypothetical protein [Burkholderia sp. JP2-270]|uniref:hypothetical protein n=1 Tax=Burkholderia sp. JP2-270 TaxID=2217913 RepID=UPI001EF938AB|nr:hypothetical protein [Burkholderia sp. JP2-270]